MKKNLCYIKHCTSTSIQLDTDNSITTLETTTFILIKMYSSIVTTHKAPLWSFCTPRVVEVHMFYINQIKSQTIFSETRYLFLLHRYKFYQWILKMILSSKNGARGRGYLDTKSVSPMYGEKSRIYAPRREPSSTTSTLLFSLGKLGLGSKIRYWICPRFFGCPRSFGWDPQGSMGKPEDCQSILTYGITSETQLHGSPPTFFFACGEVSVCGWGTYCTFENLKISSWVSEKRYSPLAYLRSMHSKVAYVFVQGRKYRGYKLYARPWTKT